MRRYLIVANQTLGGAELIDAVRERIAAGPSEFWLVVPATPVTHLEPAYLAMPVMGGLPAVTGPPEEARSVARARLDAALAQLRGVGATVDGEVGDADPLRAAEAAMSGREFDEIIVSTLPSRLSRWLRQDLPHRMEHRFGQRVVQVTSSEAPPAESGRPPRK
jgi:GABA permease